MKSERWKTVALPLIIFLLSLLIYSNTLYNGFTYDDIREIVNNRLIRGFDWKEFALTFSPGPGKPEPPGRPVPLLTFAVNYAIGGPNPVGYHLVNLLLHAGVSLLIYAVGRVIFPHRRRLSFLVAGFFACHPVHADVVAAAVGRAELISSLCFLLVLLVYLRRTPLADAERGWWYWLTLPVLLIGALSKATAFTLPFVAMVADLYRFTIREGKPPADYLSIFKTRAVKFYLPYFLVLLIAGEIYVMMPMAEELAANFLVQLPFGARLLACLGILARYLVLLLWPLRLSADYSYAQLSHHSPAVIALWTAGGILATAGGILLAWSSLKRKGSYFLAVFIFAVNYMAVSNIIILINVSMAERLIYMASWGFCLALGFFFDSALKRSKSAAGKYFLWSLIIFVLTAYSVRTWIRNRDWKDNFTLFSSAYETNPNGARVNYNLGLEYSERGDLERALFHYEKAVSIIPWNPLYHLNLGEAYAREGETEKAIDEFKRVVRLEPERAGGYINLAVAYVSRGLADQAISSLLIAREIDPDDWRIYFNLGDAYLVRREIGAAADAYEKSLELNPDHWQGWNKLGAMRLELRDPEKAVVAFRRAIEVFPQGPLPYNNLGLAYAALGEPGRAETAFRKALEIDPGFIKARNNLSLLQERLKTTGETSRSN